jgi:mono/diheme cytochrome c family protein
VTRRLAALGSRLALAALAPLAACGDGGAGAHAGHAMPPAAEARPVLPADWTPSAPTPREHANGERYFVENCVRCHGQNALGTAVGPPLLHPFYEPSHHADEAVQLAVAYGVQAHHWGFGNMPPVPNLSRAQVAEITGYIRWLQREAGIR